MFVHPQTFMVVVEVEKKATKVLMDQAEPVL
jgi:hypothetical protein